jgi:hypothetical protein
MDSPAKELETISLNDGIKAYCEGKWLKKKDKSGKEQPVEELLLKDWSIKGLEDKIESNELMFPNLYDLKLSQPRYITLDHNESRGRISILNTVNRSYNHWGEWFRKSRILSLYKISTEWKRKSTGIFGHSILMETLKLIPR